MEDSSGIDNRIKEGFESHKRAAPAGLWDDLSDKLDAPEAEIDSKLKQSFEEHEVPAPDHVWGSVNRQLNIDRVWERTRRVLNLRTAWRHGRRIAAVIAVLALLGWGGYQLLRSDQEITLTENHQAPALIQTQQEQVNESTVKEQAPRPAKRPAKKAMVIKPVKDQTSVAIKTAIASLEISMMASATKEELISMIDSNEREIAHENPMELLEVSIVTAPDKHLHVRQGNRGDQLPPKTIPTKRHRFSIGVLYAHNNTWLMNTETKRSFNVKSWTSTRATFMPGYGARVSIHLSERSALVSLVYVNSEVKQVYETYNLGRSAIKEIRLSYSKAALLYQRDLVKVGVISDSKFTLRAGPYISLLKKGGVFYNEQPAHDSNLYTRTDYGIVFQAGREMNRGRFVIGYGLNAEKGIPNIFAGTGAILASSDPTTVLNLGGYLDLRYKF